VIRGDEKGSSGFFGRGKITTGRLEQRGMERKKTMVF
jgi:hypothetical protein